MAEPTAYALSQLFSNLTGRDVTFKLVTQAPTSKARPLFGMYSVLPAKVPLLVATEPAIMGSLAGALLGLPEETAVERALAQPMDEPVRDAIHEILNIASSALSVNGRVLFDAMASDLVYCSSDAIDLMKKPDHKTSFVLSTGSLSGSFTVLQRF